MKFKKKKKSSIKQKKKREMQRLLPGVFKKKEANYIIEDRIFYHDDGLYKKVDDEEESINELLDLPLDNNKDNVKLEKLTDSQLKQFFPSENVNIEQNFIPDESYFEQLKRNPTSILGRGFRRKKPKNVKVARILPRNKINYERNIEQDGEIIRYTGQRVQSRVLSRNEDVIRSIIDPQRDYIDTVYYDHYREGIFKHIKDRMKELPNGKVIKVSLFINFSILYLKGNTVKGDFYRRNSKEAIEIVKRRFNDRDIYNVIDSLWEGLRDELFQKLDDHVPLVAGSGWIGLGLGLDTPPR